MARSGSDEPHPPDAAGSTIYQRIVNAAAADMQAPAAMPSVALMAERAGVELSLARQMFVDDAALCAAVAEDAVVRLGDFVVHRVAGVSTDHPRAQMRAIMQAHLDWALDNLLAARMFLDPNVPQACRAIYRRYIGGMQDLWGGIIARIEAAGKLNRPLDREIAELLGQSLIIGMGRTMMGDPDDFLRDRDPAAMHAMMSQAVSAYCELVYQE